MTYKTIHILFALLGIIITIISIRYLLLIPLLIGIFILIQGLWGILKIK